MIYQKLIYKKVGFQELMMSSSVYKQKKLNYHQVLYNIKDDRYE